MRVDSAAQQPQYDATRSVFIGNLPFVVDVRTLLLLVPSPTAPRLSDEPGQASAACSDAPHIELSLGSAAEASTPVSQPASHPLVVHAQTEDLLQHLEAHCAAQPGLPAVPTNVTALRVVRDPATKSSKVS